MIRISITLTCLLIIIGCSEIKNDVKDVNTDIQDIGKQSAFPESVTRARELPDDTWVTLTGKIVRDLGDHLYIFQDSTDEIKVSITEKAWNGVSFNPEIKVKITGKVNFNMHGIQINIVKVEQLAE